ncbi:MULTISPECIES: DEAD/DEAH box helicase [Streptomyces]|uniref:Superfamily II DNA or RNA helicase n=4 Tax=Streptomyces stelliscabiei TaxID=146820 RepID=A0A8I0TTJ1_9ACTN|nr:MULTISPECIES: DEAD/DEAH box helicase [Streptomyces]KND40232.1 helicase [Streptomyces stelliscabiei]MBE1601205.1 superfamily II DNA or RNA helicase [Streptomyces stelliscabiei]MDX2517027.1 DEAD/DEAH box helicase [Streptomyces stelliscabiei]MDX2554870.1 DEAD/DEAH box helicase [Streptomyces stelliscabiei]MDX2611097.1 DEAD/DEAH box helicase [Streptomyces stelliscabiei]
MGDRAAPEAGTAVPARPAVPVRLAAVFLPAPLPRHGRFAFWDPAGGEPPPGDTEDLTVVRQHGTGARRGTVPARYVTVGEALPLLTRARRDPAAHPATACWGAAALHALRLVARGRLLPGLTADGYDAWRAGPLDPDDIAHLRAVAAALPYEGHAVPLPGRGPLRLPEPEPLLRSFLDAVADTLPRGPAAPYVSGKPFAAHTGQRLPQARDWAAEVAAGMDAGVRVSLRLDLAAHDLFDDSEGALRAGAAVVQVHSLADPTLVVDAAALWAGDADAAFGPRARVDAALAVRRAARVWQPLDRLCEQDVPDVLALSEDELSDLLGVAATRLGAAGVAVHWPRDLAHDLSARAEVRPAPGSATDGTGFFEGEELLRFRWQLALGGDPLTEAEMDTLAEAHRPIVRLRDQWVLVDPALVRKARKRELGLLDPVDALSVALSGTAEVDGETVEAVPVGALAALRDRLTAGVGPVDPPPGLSATLRDYQLRGLAWLDLMTSLGLGGCLADDMGLGKTITVIALHLRRARPEPTLVVCPASLLGNWQREIARFAPGVPVRRFHGPDRTLDDLQGGFVLTTYGTMRSTAPRLAQQDWGMVVADEAQHVKNPYSATAKALRTIPTPARVALTGTPVENNLSELWALLDWTTPGLLGPLKSFRARHARAVENGENPGHDEAVTRLARLVRPFLLRRKKSDPGIVPELPPKTETDHPVPLTREQAALYEAVVRESLLAIETAQGIARRGLVLKLLGALKQICDHPALYLKEEPDSATGDRFAARSGKLALLDELLDTLLSEDGSALVFTQYVGMARLITAHLAARAVPVELLHGGTPVKDREHMVDRFQSGATPVLVLSLKAAGTGLNLTRAGHVVHFDRWWNPAVEEQATDRAYRIGQTQPVQVHRLITEGTVEDRIAEMLESKRALSDAILGSGEAALTELTDRELTDLVSLRRSA